MYVYLHNVFSMLYLYLQLSVLWFKTRTVSSDLYPSKYPDFLHRIRSSCTALGVCFAKFYVFIDSGIPLAVSTFVAFSVLEIMHYVL